MVNPFKNSTWRWWQMSLFKISLLAIGIAIGANWPAFFSPLTTLLVIVGVVTAIYVTLVWWRQ